MKMNASLFSGLTKLLLAGLMAITFAFSSALPVLAADSRVDVFLQDVVDSDEEARQINYLDEYARFVKRRGPHTVKLAGEAIKELSAGSNEGDAELALVIKKYKAKYSEVIAAAENIAVDGGSSLESADKELTAALIELDRFVSNNNTKVASENNKLTAIYGGLVGLFAVVSAGLFFWRSRASSSVMSDDRAAQLQQTARYELFKTSLWPLGGATVTLVWFLMIRNSGGTYYVLWGPMAFGVFALIRGIVDYRKSVSSNEFESVAAAQEKLDSESEISFDVVVSTRKGVGTIDVQSVLQINKQNREVCFNVGDPPEKLSLKAEEIKRVALHPSRRFVQISGNKRSYLVTPLGSISADIEPLKSVHKRKLSEQESIEMERILYVLQNL